MNARLMSVLLIQAFMYKFLLENYVGGTLLSPGRQFVGNYGDEMIGETHMTQKQEVILRWFLGGLHDTVWKPPMISICQKLLQLSFIRVNVNGSDVKDIHRASVTVLHPIVFTKFVLF